MAKEIVQRYIKCHNIKTFAENVYRDLQKINYTDEDLLEVYMEMNSCSLSFYEIEQLTKKKLELDYNGRYHLVDISPENSINNILADAINALNAGSKDKTSTTSCESKPKFEVGKTYLNNNEYAGKMMKTPSGRSFYCPKEFTVIKDNGKLHKLNINSYTIVDDKGFESTIDDESYQSVTLKE